MKVNNSRKTDLKTLLRLDVQNYVFTLTNQSVQFTKREETGGGRPWRPCFNRIITISVYKVIT